MMNRSLTVQNKHQHLLATMDVRSRKYIVPALSKKITETEPQQTVQSLADKITSCYALAGQKPDAVDVFIHADELYKAAIARFPLITIDEINTALTNGFYGDYGEYFGLNTKTFMMFIKEYYNSDERKQAVKQFNDALALPMYDKPTPEQTAQSNRELMELLYEDFRKSKLIFEFIPSFLYDFIIQEKLIQSNVAHFDELKSRAARHYESLIRKTKTSRAIGTKMRSMFESENPEIRVLNMAKSLGVYEYFINAEEQNMPRIFPHQIENAKS